MKKSSKVVLAVVGVLSVFGMMAAAGAQTAAQSPLEYLTEAKGVFERACNVCHGLEKPLSKTFDKAGWEKTVERMHDNGAEVGATERAQIVSYLLTKNIFEAKCSVCHEIERPLGANKTPGDWLSTVQRMSGKKPGHLSEAEVSDISAYLAITRPVQK